MKLICTVTEPESPRKGKSNYAPPLEPHCALFQKLVALLTAVRFGKFDEVSTAANPWPDNIAEPAPFEEQVWPSALSATRSRVHVNTLALLMSGRLTAWASRLYVGTAGPAKAAARRSPPSARSAGAAQALP